MWSQLCIVIMCTVFCLYIINLMANKNVCAKFEEPRSILCLLIIWTRFGLYVNMLMVTVTLTFDRLTSKSIGIIYTPRRMSVPNLTNLGQDLPTDICKAIYPFFVEGGHYDNTCTLLTSTLQFLVKH